MKKFPPLYKKTAARRAKRTGITTLSQVIITPLADVISLRLYIGPEEPISLIMSLMMMNDDLPRSFR